MDLRDSAALLGNSTLGHGILHGPGVRSLSTSPAEKLGVRSTGSTNWRCGTAACNAVWSTILGFGREGRPLWVKRLLLPRSWTFFPHQGWQVEGTICSSVFHFSLSQLCNYSVCPSSIVCWTLKFGWEVALNWNVCYSQLRIYADLKDSTQHASQPPNEARQCFPVSLLSH